MENKIMERKFGTYYTANPWLYDYLFNAGFKPDRQTIAETGKITWEYTPITEAQREIIQQFRINQNDKESIQ